MVFWFVEIVLRGDKESRGVVMATSLGYWVAKTPIFFDFAPKRGSANPTSSRFTRPRETYERMGRKREL